MLLTNDYFSKRNTHQRNLKTTILTSFIKKMAFTGSLRKTLFGLLLVMVFLVMFLYWNENQSSLKPAGPSMLFAGILNRDAGGGNSGSFLGGALPPPKISPPEKIWTYKCVNNRCLRQHYVAADHPESAGSGSGKRVPFLTCTMTCGPINIWPQPTGKTTIGSKASRFQLADTFVHIKTNFKPVENLLREAFGVFRDELRAVLVAHGVPRDDVDSSSMTEDNEVTKGRDSDSEIAENPGMIRFSKAADENRFDIEKFDVRITVQKSPETHLTLHTDESYNLSVSHTARILTAKIFANSFFGAKHALTTLQQLVWFDDEERILKILNKALIEDVPRFNFRGLMLDTSRHYFSVESIKRTLVGMSHSKLNRFHWHITDSQSFPLVSKHYPQLAHYGAYSDKEVYTSDDMKEIVNFAKVRGIQIIPEIDAPAHAGNGWDWGPKHNMGELSLCINQQPWSYYCGEPPCGQLNPKNNNTYLILQRLYEELLDLTGPLDYFHLGGDEVNLECWQQHFNESDMRTLWCDFMQQAYHRLQVANQGIAPKLVAVWSSGLTGYPCLSKNAYAVQIWGGSKWPENYQLINAGFNVVMSHVDAWYLDCGFGSWRSTAEGACSPYRNWQTVYKHRPWDELKLTSLQMRQVLGGEACLWTEQVDESTLDSRLWPRASALAERLWTDPVEEIYSESVPKETFNRMSVFRNHLLELGLRAEPIFPKYCAQNQDECV
ncbi:probable beta-hexosaminidase fdl isoform X2 [Topomyia yanbarensis]|uniref:probable beta-hexosaminidase fdl isoform X2 n=1 Tax=Topomyia yanbarensis TaxID=2498891 RepID=UPI00273CCF0F|nr:probable beta-hexosaminidase fdl isoform X2 [Topomyia yanbarensis]XP_058837709.1 probable beta-hexosaminidase fdl isoform X2 [Topomyia yanbarensis]XP_058837711.1 probable beta-hexosaminidase fdl isoform X2 [Topomyia yanbarensis]XP_058837712.1 probable beta-hexosaminidase fdl isoform X2 [Topomyia yanbarensis]XP_058837713.1 probable beta-hexosaminidase fdl isoform X2 [Topomyia yanbarensis]